MLRLCLMNMQTSSYGVSAWTGGLGLLATQSLQASFGAATKRKIDAASAYVFLC